MQKILILLVCLLATTSLLAQGFAPRILMFSSKKPSFITMTDGTERAVLFKRATRKKGLLKKVVVSDTLGGENEKIMAADIQSMRLAPSALGKFAAFSESSSSIKEMQNKDATSALKRDYVYFEQAILSKKGVPVLLQVVNPGFDSKIKVYDDPRARETAGLGVAGVQVTGGLLASYYAQEDAGLAWSVLDMETGNVRRYGAFVPTADLIYLFTYFDQFMQSHRIWSPDSRYIVYAEVGENETNHVSLLDTSTRDTVPVVIAVIEIRE